uniref:Uncharacterized protein n=1 Tax=Trypanosoma congolense (strain IL3000) TaxID=1068625 RepID=G0V2L4_TRYCI|nr:hypothetical protein, unlikely [Trypanosoma congolense IL3000]
MSHSRSETQLFTCANDQPSSMSASARTRRSLSTVREKSPVHHRRGSPPALAAAVVLFCTRNCSSKYLIRTRSFNRAATLSVHKRRHVTPSGPAASPNRLKCSHTSTYVISFDKSRPVAFSIHHTVLSSRLLLLALTRAFKHQCH